HPHRDEEGLRAGHTRRAAEQRRAGPARHLLLPRGGDEREWQHLRLAAAGLGIRTEAQGSTTPRPHLREGRRTGKGETSSYTMAQSGEGGGGRIGGDRETERERRECYTLLPYATLDKNM